MAKYQDLVSEEDWLIAIDGHAWVVGDHLPRRAVLADAHLDSTAEQAAPQLFQDFDPRIASSLKPGDFIVAGLGFAEDANQKLIPAALMKLGVAAVIARSYGHYFLKNAINLGLPALVIEETGAILNGDRLRVDVEAHVVANKSSGDRYVIRNLNTEDIAILRAGGLIAYTQQQRQGSS